MTTPTDRMKSIDAFFDAVDTLVENVTASVADIPSTKLTADMVAHLRPAAYRAMVAVLAADATPPPAPPRTRRRARRVSRTYRPEDIDLQSYGS